MGGVNQPRSAHIAHLARLPHICPETHPIQPDTAIATSFLSFAHSHAPPVSFPMLHWRCRPPLGPRREESALPTAADRLPLFPPPPRPRSRTCRTDPCAGLQSYSRHTDGAHGSMRQWLYPETCPKAGVTRGSSM